MPGTLNVGDCIPVMTEFLLFLGLVEVSPLTLISMIGANIVSKWAAGLVGWKLIVAVSVNFLLGALMTIGVGLYTPCIALCSALGLNVKIAFPVMFGFCAFLMPSCGFEFIKRGNYDRSAAVWMTVGGAVGIFIAFCIVRSLPLTILPWIIIVDMLYTAAMFFKDVVKNAE